MVTSQEGKEKLDNHPKDDKKKGRNHISDFIPQFLEYARIERRFSPRTIEKYQECIYWFIRDVGDLKVEEIKPVHFIKLKQKMMDRGAKEARIAGVIFAIKSILKYCEDYHQLKVIDLSLIKSPRQPKREVTYLTNEEFSRFVETIKIYNFNKTINRPALRFRTLVEILTGTGMRISEALSINWQDIDFKNKEVMVIGKGGKERVVFFNDRAIFWIKKYLKERKDQHPALFVTNNGLKRWQRNEIWRLFKRYRMRAGLSKKVSPHILRHTMATNLLSNGCPIGYIKEILGHERLETTCKFYLGILDKANSKTAHEQYLNFD